MTLDRLLTAAGVLWTWDRRFWFGGCTLRGSLLLAPDADTAATLRRCYLPQLQAVVSDLEIRAGTPEPKAKTARAAYRGQAPVPLKQGDML